MKVIDKCCCECITQNLNRTKESCPVCNNEGVTVSRITVEHLVTDDYRNAVDGDQYKICMNEDCDVWGVCCHKIIQEAIDKGLTMK